MWLLLFLMTALFAQETERENYFLEETPVSVLPTVDPVTGVFVIDETDFVVNGVEPLSLIKNVLFNKTFKRLHNCKTTAYPSLRDKPRRLQ